MNSEVVHYDTSDRLSELPDELLIQILSILQIKDAVRTVLLRRFGNLWTLLPTLTFDYSEEDEDDIEVEEEEEFISNVLKFHKSPTIDKLVLHEVYFDLEENMSDCIYFAIKKKTKKLSVRVSDNVAYYNLPPCVFSTQSIVSLYLDNMAITLPPRVSMGSLKILSLTFVYFDEAALEGIISGCPCLQELFVLDAYIIQDQLHISSPTIEKLFLSVDRDNRGHEMVTIDCPNLKILRIEQTSLDFLRLTNVSSVFEAVIEYCPSYCCKHPKSSDQFENLLHKFCNAHLFQLEDEAYLQLKPCGTGKLAFQKNSWVRRLALRSGNSGGCLLNICRWLKKSQRLEELVIYGDVDYFCGCNRLRYELSAPSVMQKLKTVTIREYKKPCTTLLQLIKFLLKNAVVLDKLVISTKRKDKLFSSEGQKLYSELLSFPRASSEASIIFA